MSNSVKQPLTVKQCQAALDSAPLLQCLAVTELLLLSCSVASLFQSPKCCLTEPTKV